MRKKTIFFSQNNKTFHDSSVKMFLKTIFPKMITSREKSYQKPFVIKKIEFFAESTAQTNNNTEILDANKFTVIGNKTNGIALIFQRKLKGKTLEVC